MRTSPFHFRKGYLFGNDMRSHYTILLCRYAGVTALYLNGMEAMRSVNEVASIRQFRYPSGTQSFNARHVPGPHPTPTPTLGGLVLQALRLCSWMPAPESDHSRLAMIDESGQVRSYVNGLPVMLAEDASPLPAQIVSDFMLLAGRSDIALSEES